LGIRITPFISDYFDQKINFISNDAIKKAESSSDPAVSIQYLKRQFRNAWFIRALINSRSC